MTFIARTQEILTKGKILVARACGIGDALQLTAFLRAINILFPDANVTVAVSSYARPVLENLNLKFNLIELPRGVMSPNRWRQFFSWLKFSKQISGKFDVGFFFVSLFTNSMAFKFCKIPIKVGLVTNSWKPFLPYTHIIWIPKDPRDLKIPIGRIFLQGLEILGFDVSSMPLNYEYNITKRESNWAFNLIGKSTRPRVGLCVQVGNEASPFKTKAYPVENWILLVKLLLRNGFEVFIFGKDKLTSEWEIEGVNNLTERFTIRETAALLSLMDIIVSADSGLLHLAAAIGKKVIGLYGPTSPDVYGPIAINDCVILSQRYNCTPCYKSSCNPSPIPNALVMKKPYCMYNINPNNVFETILNMVNK
jgi:heptosyltransferase-2